jgi:hypothetical protein
MQNVQVPWTQIYPGFNLFIETRCFLNRKAPVFLA